MQPAQTSEKKEVESKNNQEKDMSQDIDEKKDESHDTLGKQESPNVVKQLGSFNLEDEKEKRDVKKI